MQAVYADVIVDITEASASKSYQYLIPEKWRDEAEPGRAVTVPFGRGGRTVDGYIISTGDTPKLDPSKIREIADMPENRMTIESRLIRLALWMHRTYGSSLNNALKTVLLVRDREKEPVREKITLAVSAEEGRCLLSTYERKHQSAKVRLLSELLNGGTTDRTDAASRLKAPRSTVDSLLRDGVIRISACTILRGSEPEEDAEDEAEPALSEEQQDVIRSIREEWDGDDRPSLLLGVTGSGKTMVYMELIDGILKEGRQAIVLIPEIALSWQNVNRFRKRFGKQVTIMNSRMSRGERADQYERMKRGEAGIVIGPRSALFAPFPDPGLIIVDEEQERSYRSETAPRYDAREAAIERGRLEHAHVLFGSATPSVDTYYRCQTGQYALFRLRQRYGGASLPSVSVIDMREELRHGSRSDISAQLLSAIEDRLKKKEQVILFLNRRGFSGFVSCRSCGNVIRCPHCDVSLTLHANGKLICHYCGYEQDMVKRCPVCGSPHISGFHAGTEKAEEELHRIFPTARILRMDADTTKTKNGHSRILHTFASGGADILIGTQMIIKGHDFPNVTLVGVLAADQSLFESDYRAAEHTYGLLVQAAGRAGRGRIAGEAMIQTFNPDHYSIQAAVKQDYESFYSTEIAARNMLDYPPAAQLLAVHGSGKNGERLHTAMAQLLKFLKEHVRKDIMPLGPAPEVISRINDVYREVLYIKAPTEKRAVEVRQLLEKFIEINSGFHGLIFQYDLNA